MKTTIFFMLSGAKKLELVKIKTTKLVVLFYTRRGWDALGTVLANVQYIKSPIFIREEPHQKY